jgi:hypothetical protein
MADRQTGPVEPHAGQDEAPDLDLAVRAAIRLLSDLRRHLEAANDDEGRDLGARSGALLRAFLRLRAALDEKGA